MAISCNLCNYSVVITSYVLLAYCVFQVAETEEEEKERLANWDKFLNEEDDASGSGKEKSEEGKESKV